MPNQGEIQFKNTIEDNNLRTFS